MQSYAKLVADESSLKKELTKEEKIKESLNQELLNFESDAYIEKIARERLKLLKDDEQIFIIN